MQNYINIQIERVIDLIDNTYKQIQTIVEKSANKPFIGNILKRHGQYVHYRSSQLTDSLRKALLTLKQTIELDFLTTKVS